MRIFEVAKGTGTYADSLMAIGMASLLEEISGTQTIIRDMGTHFQIGSSAEVSDEQWRPPSPGFYYIWRKSKEKEKPQGTRVLDYEEEQGRVKAKKKGNKKTDALNKALEEQGLSPIESVNREYGPSAILESMRKGWSSDKDVYQWVIQNPEKTLKWVQSELNPLGKIEQVEHPGVSNSQFFNPASGKGVHAAKTTYKSPGAINSDIVDPFAEWMKFRGASAAMLPYRNGDDFKLFVIEPAEIGPMALSMLREKLLDLRLWGGIRLDIEAALRLAEELIMHSDVVQEADEWEIILLGRKPAEIIRGLRQAYFKSMGTAAALMNDAFLPLPSWFRIDSSEDANTFLGIIREHIGYYENGQRKQGSLGSLDETHSGDVPILQQYRKWITTSDKWDLLDFLAKFAVHIMERRVKDEWAKEFSTANLTILFERGYDMKEIVENPGFLSVARGIRNCTIYAVSLGEREPHFGLAQQWKQKIKGGVGVFVPVLCDFVQTQNWEVEHRLKGKGHSIKREDLDSVIGLIQKHGVELVGMLLLAYGYARAPKIETENSNITNKEDK